MNRKAVSESNNTSLHIQFEFYKMYEMSLIFLMSIWRKCGVNWSRKTRFFCSFHILFRLDCQKNIHAAHRWMMACAFFFLSPSPLLDSSPVIFIKIHSSRSLVARENHYFIDYRSISVNRSLPSIIDAHFMSQFVMFFFVVRQLLKKLRKLQLRKRDGHDRIFGWISIIWVVIPGIMKITVFIF